jgi:conjugative relaxase-like TrwC/TraI family protein
MVSITSVGAGQAASYYTQKDNYYTQANGQWHGKGAELLDLTGPVSKDDFVNLLSGKDIQGNQIIHSGVGKNQGERRAGVDLTFSAPKSLSILSEIVGGEEGERFRDAHDRAVVTTLQYVEANYAQARQSDSGRVSRVDTGNLLIATFQHNLSRQLDPQLHTHAVLINQTLRQDEKMVAVDYREIYDNKMLIGQFYRNELAANLKEIGYTVSSDDKGLFEVSGIDKTLLDTFSRRSEQIDSRIKELKESGLYPNAQESKLKEIAALGSREAKQDVDINDLRQSWEDRLKDLGYTSETIIDHVVHASITANLDELIRKEPGMNEFDYVRRAADLITQTESTFSKEDVLLLAGKFAVGEYRISELENAFYELKQDIEFVTLNSTYGIYSTQQMLAIESKIVDQVRADQGSHEAVMSDEDARAAIENTYRELTDDQKKAVEHILTTKDFISGVQGSAGAGKTTMLHAVREELEKAGITVRGLSYTGKAAEELQTGSGIESQTIHSFLASDDFIPEKRELWIVDEASMIGSRQMHNLMEKAGEANAQIVLVGDIKQLQSLHAGPIFERLQSIGTMNTVFMDSVVRQDTGMILDVAQLAQKIEHIDSVFDKLHEHAKIYELPERAERLNSLVKDFTSLDSLSDSLVITSSNRDRNELNSLIREELKEQGRLSGEEYTFTVRESKNLLPEEKHFAQAYSAGEHIYAQKSGVIGRAGTEAIIDEVDYDHHRITVETDRGKIYEIDLKEDGDKVSVYSEKEASFAAGDQIIFTKNDSHLQVKNGLRGEIENLTTNGDFTVELSNGREVIFNISQYPYIDSAYAVTDFKAQGQSVREVFYHADTSQGVDYNKFYVSLTRAKSDIQIYTDDTEILREQTKEAQEKSFTLDHVTGYQSDDENESQMDKDKEAISSEKTTSPEKEGSDQTQKDNEKDGEQQDYGKEDSDTGYPQQKEPEKEIGMSV